MNLEIRKFTKFVDKTFIEGGKKAKEPVLLVSVAAVFKNPWHGQGFVEDLRPTILDLAPKLGDMLVPELIKEMGSPDKILAYGKAGVVGLNGEIEHASAFIHTLRFGNKFRDAVEEQLLYFDNVSFKVHLENDIQEFGVVGADKDGNALYQFEFDVEEAL